jgi:hypothetical protein
MDQKRAGFILPDNGSRASFQNIAFLYQNETMENVQYTCQFNNTPSLLFKTKLFLSKTFKTLMDSHNSK